MPTTLEPSALLALRASDLGASLHRAQAELDAFLVTHAIDARAAYRANLVFEELATNALKYGGGDGETVVVEGRVTVEGGAVVFELADRGVPFDPTSVPPTPAVSSIENAPIGGLGLALVRKVASAIRYTRVGGENRTLVRIALERA